MEMSTSGHLVLDLAALKYKPRGARTSALPGVSLVTNNLEPRERSYGVADCPACAGQHRKHTCGQGGGAPSKPLEKKVVVKEKGEEEEGKLEPDFRRLSRNRQSAMTNGSDKWQNGQKRR